MNFHVLLVHFPVALLTLYALFEFARWKKLLSWEPWFFIKGMLAILGFGAAVVGDLSGQLIEDAEATDAARASIIELHSTFALLTIAIFALPALAYLVEWLDRTKLVKSLHGWKAWPRIRHAAQWFLKSYWIIAVAFFGLLAVSVTGALGGGLVNGAGVDPFVALVYRIFGL